MSSSAIDDCYDIVIAGGGIAGSSLAIGLKDQGLRILVIEKTESFQDRVRGEAILPWGVLEARELGIEQLLLDHCGHVIPEFEFSFGADHSTVRDLRETTPHNAAAISFPHPRMQQVLIDAVFLSGCDVIRDAKVEQFKLDEGLSQVSVRHHSHTKTVRTRLIIGADGRNSLLRSLARFRVESDPTHLLSSGVLLGNVCVPRDRAYFKFNLLLGEMSLLIPHGTASARVYLFHQASRGIRYSGRSDLDNFLRSCFRAGFDPGWFEQAEPMGPLATFDGAAKWISHPARPGVAFLGDAAGSSDPTWGSGLSESLRDARLLRDALVRNADWREAVREYAAARDEGYQRLRTVDRWYAELLMTPSPQNLDRLRRIVPFLAEDLSRMPDFIGLGPAVPISEATRQRFYCEDCDTDLPAGS